MIYETLLSIKLCERKTGMPCGERVARSFGEVIMYLWSLVPTKLECPRLVGPSGEVPSSLAHFFFWQRTRLRGDHDKANFQCSKGHRHSAKPLPAFWPAAALRASAAPAHGRVADLRFSFRVRYPKKIYI
jgi:hypothetical protein